MMQNFRSRIADTARLFAASTRGIAAVEFAMVIPVLLILLLATFDGGRAIAIYMKVRSATYTLGAVTNQYSIIQSTDMTSIVGATALVLQPYSSAPIIVRISQLSMNSSGQTTVSWSYSLNGTALTQGSSVTIPTSFAPTNNATCGSYPCYLILAQVSYAFSPSFNYFTTGTITLSDNLYVTPRSSTCVLYPPQNVNSC
jgi:Flp pilus assembly protein TadG